MLNGRMFRNWVVSYRIKNDLSLNEVAKLTGIPISRLSALENDELANPSLRYFVGFAKALGYRHLSEFIAVVEGLRTE
jgi:transcriptional regulator with XRE-family HTH domain